MARVHPSALVDPRARLADDVEVGAFSVVGAGVSIGPGSVVGPHVVIDGTTTVGERNRIFPFASIGLVSQDRKYGGEPVTTTIGDDNVIREYTSIHAGTAQDRGDTRIGNGNWFLAYTHVAHDCVIGSHTTWSNNAQVAGHVQVGDWAVLGAYAGVHQFCRVGEHAMLAPTAKGCGGAASRPNRSSPFGAPTRRSTARAWRSRTPASGSRKTRRRSPSSRRWPRSSRSRDAGSCGEGEGKGNREWSMEKGARLSAIRPGHGNTG